MSDAMVRWLSASELARHILPEIDWPHGSEDARVFGKIVHEEYARCEYLYVSSQRRRDGAYMRPWGNHRRILAARIRAAGLPSAMVTRAIRISAALKAAKVTGLTPKTKFSPVDDDEECWVAYKPDLVDGRGPAWELKTHPITTYDRNQAAVFALAGDWTVVNLVGIDTGADGMVRAVVEEISPYPDVERLAAVIRERGQLRERPAERDEEQWGSRRRGRFAGDDEDHEDNDEEVD